MNGFLGRPETKMDADLGSASETFVGSPPRVKNATKVNLNPETPKTVSTNKTWIELT
jgi:hypothetical protein